MPRKLIKSFSYARAGTEHALKTQRNLWIHLAVGLIVLLGAIFFGVSRVELAVLVLTVGLVISTEMVNTALEEMTNILSPENRREAALAKNIAAGAVLLAVIGAVIIGLIIFLPKVMP